jgi:hypothetical protein
MARISMIEACLTATQIDFVRLVEIARGLEGHFRFVSPPARPGGAGRGAVRLHFTADRQPEPIMVDPERGVTVSTWDVDGACRYAGIDEQTYLLICSLIGISHWRVLDVNPLLRPEDLRHPPGVHCLYMDARHVADFALLLDEPRVCAGCADFYHCLGADTELLALREVLNELSADRVNEPQESDAERARRFERDE